MQNNITNVLLIMVALALVDSLNIPKMKMSIDYFEFKNIKQICTISCTEDQDTIQLTKLGAKNSIFVSNVKITSVVIEQKYKDKLIHTCWKQHLQQIGILIESSCRHFEEIMILASEELMLSSTHQWLIIQNQWNEADNDIFNNTSDVNCDDMVQADIKDPEKELIRPETIDVINKLNISVDADIVLAVETDPTSYKLFDSFNFGRIQGGKLNIVNFGTWNKGLQVVLTENKYRRRRDFQGLGLRMVFVKSNPSDTFDPKRLISRESDHEINVMVKLSASVLIELAEEYNIKFVFKAVDRWIGSFEPNSSRAVSTTLAYREYDVSPVIRAISELYGVGMLEFAQPSLVWYMGSKYFYRIPDSGTGNFENNFLSPLSGIVWLCVVLSLLLCVIVLRLSARLEQRPRFAQYAVFSVWAHVCQQCFDDATENVLQKISCARKVTMLTTGLSCVLIYNYYTSSVVSNLLNGPPPSINSLEELANSPLQLILEASGISRSWLHYLLACVTVQHIDSQYHTLAVIFSIKYSRCEYPVKTPGYTFDPRFPAEENYLKKKKILTKKPGDPLLVSLDEGVAMVKSGGYAFAALEEGANAKFGMVLDQREMCQIGSFYAVPPGIVYPVLPYKGGYREFFVWSITSFKEHGIINSINQRVRSAKIKCVGTIPRALALGGAAPAFVMLALGFIVAVGVMVVEILEHRFSTISLIRS